MPLYEVRYGTLCVALSLAGTLLRYAVWRVLSLRLWFVLEVRFVLALSLEMDAVPLPGADGLSAVSSTYQVCCS